MLFKYLVNVENISVGVIFDFNKNEMRVGGPALFKDFMESLIVIYAGFSVVYKSSVDKSKIRYKTNQVPEINERHRQFLTSCENQAIVVTMVKSLGRLMR